MRVLASREGRFGQVRVLERKSDGARLYCIDASVQTTVQPDGVGLFGYGHAAKLTLRTRSWSWAAAVEALRRCLHARVTR